MPHDFDLLCIGSGPAGQRAAVQAAKLGKRAALVERERVVGGVCLHSGTIPSKTFREAVLYFAQRAEVRPTAAQLVDRVNRVVARETEVLGHQLQRNGVSVLRGHAMFTDAHTLTLTGEGSQRAITAANILIAVGTRPAPPPGVAVDREVVATSDDVAGLTRLPRTVTVVGGGVIGM